MREEIEIVGLEIVNRPNKSNILILSYFDMRTRGFLFRGCVLLRTPDGVINWWPPRLHNGGEDQRRLVGIEDSELRAGICERALRAHEQLTGQPALTYSDVSGSGKAPGD